MSLILVADIGGTNARFGTVDLANSSDGKSHYLAGAQHKLRCADYPDIASMIRAYGDVSGQPLPPYACLAIAGPIQQGRVKMTNLSWEFGIDELRRELGMKALDVINDFAALAYATPHLGEGLIKTLRAGEAHPEAPLLCLGPGTGFGMASLVPTSSGWKIVPTEGGHCNFAPGNAQEIAILQYWLERQDHVSVENLMSGQGLVRIYQALASLAGQPAQDYEPVDVSLKGQSGEDPLCRQALDQFFAILGSTVGDRALTSGAQGGVFIGGGIVTKLSDYLPKTDFLKRYGEKGPMSGYVEHIPLSMIVEDSAALVGTAAWLIDQVPELTQEVQNL